MADLNTVKSFSFYRANNINGQKFSRKFSKKSPTAVERADIT